MNITEPCPTGLDFLHDKNYVRIALYIPVGLLALIANVLVIIVVIKFHYMRNVTNYFLVNLSVADLLVTLLCMPNGAITAYTHIWYFGEVACKLKNYLQCISVASSVFTITAMALDRYLAITQPFGFCRWFTKKSTIIIIISMWIASMAIFSPLLYVAELYLIEPINLGNITVCNSSVNEPKVACIENWQGIESHLPRSVFGTVSFTIMFAMPGTIILWAYSMMGRQLCSVRPPFDNNSISTQQGYRLVRERKRVAWILLMLVLVFAVCWLPYNTANLLIDHGLMEDSTTLTTYLPYMLLLGHFNSALNPIIYCAMSKNFRKSVKQILCPSRIDFEARRNHRLQVKWADSSGSSRRVCLQRINRGPPIHIQVHLTLSPLQSSQKTTKTCAV